MKLMNIAAIAATAGLIFSACSQEELVYQPTKTQEEYPMGFSAGVPNKTRTALNQYGPTNGKYDNFGVWAIKTKDVTENNVTTTTYEFPMENYKVVYSASQPTGTGEGQYWDKDKNSENGFSFWYYDGIKVGEKDKQTIKYWDLGAKQYDFIAYAKYDANAETLAIPEADQDEATPKSSTNIWFSKQDKKMSVKLGEAGFTDNNAVLVAHQTSHPKVDNPVTGTSYFENDVPLAFHHLNGEVLFRFTTTLTGFTGTIQGLKVSLTNISKKGTASVNFTGADTYSIDSEKISWSEETGFAPETTATFTTSSSLDSKKFFCLPTDGDGQTMTVKITYTLTDGTETFGPTEETITIANGTNKINEWAGNKRYVYKFKFGLSPIIFDGIDVSDMTEVTASETTIIPS